MEQLLDEGQPIPLPDIGPVALRLWQHLQDAGLAGYGPMGRVPLSWSELRAWLLATGQRLAPWQLRALREASAHWLGEHLRAASPDAPAPWSEQPDEAKRNAIRDKVRAVLGARARESSTGRGARA